MEYGQLPVLWRVSHSLRSIQIVLLQLQIWRSSIGSQVRADVDADHLDKHHQRMHRKDMNRSQSLPAVSGKAFASAAGGDVCHSGPRIPNARRHHQPQAVEAWTTSVGP